jgi:hypothetical protein
MRHLELDGNLAMKEGANTKNRRKGKECSAPTVSKRSSTDRMSRLTPSCNQQDWEEEMSQRRFQEPERKE